MISTLLNIKRLCIIRDEAFEDTVADYIVKGIVAFTFTAFAFLLGFCSGILRFDDLIGSNFLALAFVSVLCFDFITKNIFGSKHIDFAPYLILPIKKSSLFTSAFIRQLYGYRMSVYLAFFIPFIISSNCFDGSVISAMSFLLFLYSILVAINVLVFSLKQLINSVILQFCISVIIAVSFFFLLSNISDFLQDLLINYAVIKLMLSVLIIGASYKLYMFSLNKEIISNKQNEQSDSIQSAIANIFGFKDEVMQLLLKILLRCKQIRLISILILVGVFIYLPLLKSALSYSQSTFLIFIAIASSFTTLLTMQAISLISMPFDGLMCVKKNFLLKYIKYVYILSVILSLLICLLLLVSTKEYLLSITSFFIAIGPVSFINMQQIKFSKARFDILATQNRNNRNQFTFKSQLLMFGSFLAFCFASGIAVGFGYHEAFMYVMLAIGIIFTLLSPLWLKSTYNSFMKNKYEAMSGFRA